MADQRGHALTEGAFNQLQSIVAGSTVSRFFKEKKQQDLYMKHPDFLMLETTVSSLVSTGDWF